MIVNPVEMIRKAKAGKYGVGCFNAFDYDSVEAVISSAEETNTPVIVGILDFSDPSSPFPQFFMDGRKYSNFMCFLRDRARAAHVPVAIHLDHCNTYDGCIRAIQAGATSVMLDASHRSFEENVRLTNEVVRAAHSCGVAVEGEIGQIAGHETGHVADRPNAPLEMYTTVEDAIAYYEATGIELMAVSVGSVHGVLTSKPVLQYELMARLRDAVPCGLVMHGASGMSEAEYAQSVQNGITKLNFASYLQIGMADAMRTKLLSTDKPMFAMEVNKAQIAGGKEIIKKHIALFRTQPIV